MKLPLAALALLASSCYVTVPFQGLASGVEAPALEVDAWVNTESCVEVDGSRSRPLLIEFWSSECPPCVRSIPKLNRVVRDYDGRIDVVTVHVDLEVDRPMSIEALTALVIEHGIRYPVGLDTSGTQWDRFHFGHLPHAVLVDVDGRVRWSGNLVLHDLEGVLRRKAGSVNAAR